MAKRHLPGAPGRTGPRDGLHRPGAGEGDHDHGENRLRGLPRRQDQHRGHPRARRLRRRGGADAQDGGRGPAPRRRFGGAASADAFRAQQGAGEGTSRRPGGEQGRPPGCQDRRGDQRSVRPLHRSGCDGRPARVSHPAYECPGGGRTGSRRGGVARPSTAVRRDPLPHPPALGGPGERPAAARHAPRLQRVCGPACGRTGLLRDPPGGGFRIGVRTRGCRGAGQGNDALRIRRAVENGGAGGLRRGHRRAGRRGDGPASGTRCPMRNARARSRG